MGFIMVYFPWCWGYIVINVEHLHARHGAPGAGLPPWNLYHSYDLQVASRIQSSYKLSVIIDITEGGNCLKVVVLAWLIPIPLGLYNTVFSITDISCPTIFWHLNLDCFWLSYWLLYWVTHWEEWKMSLSNSVSGYFVFCLQIVRSIGLMFDVVYHTQVELNPTIIVCEMELNSSG